MLVSGFFDRSEKKRLKTKNKFLIPFFVCSHTLIITYIKSPGSSAQDKGYLRGSNPWACIKKNLKVSAKFLPPTETSKTRFYKLPAATKRF